MVLNVKEAKQLIGKYRSVTLVMLEKEDCEPWGALSNITGFGYHHTCTLCKAVKRNCSECIHSLSNNNSGDYYCIEDTARAIYNATSYEELLEAIKDRADYLETLLKYDN